MIIQRSTKYLLKLRDIPEPIYYCSSMWSEEYIKGCKNWFSIGRVCTYIFDAYADGSKVWTKTATKDYPI